MQVTFLASSKRWWLGAVVACAGSLAGAQTPAALGLEQALQQAEQRSRQLTAQDAATTAAQAQAVAAGQLPDPVLQASVNNVPVQGPSRYSLTQDFMTARSLALRQEFTRADKRAARSARFGREAELAQAGKVVALADLRTQTALAWLDLAHLTKIDQLLQAQRREAALQVEASDLAFRAARGSQADVFEARLALAQMDERLQQSQGDLATARADLTRWVGEVASGPLGPLPALDQVPWTPQTLAQALAQHPQLQALAAREAVAQADVTVAQRNRRADWSVELSYSQRGPGFANMVSVGVAIPLQLQPQQRQDQELAARLAMAEQVQDEREELRRTLLAQTRGWLDRWRSGQDRLALYDTQLLPLAQQRSQAALVAYRSGTGSLTGVLAARRQALDTQLAHGRLALDQAQLWARLSYLLPVDTLTPAGNTP